ncbi:nuclease-related domain-containing protein [Kribbella sp. NPDC049174]|uniref:nuclease-related domain-containing protein n=1 Tax=Kribbella sp. NPDC049174 TaxID=3364112 RepID=UPI003720FB16
MESLKVVRWQRYGHDRLYVHGPDGELGWVDLKTDAIHAKTNRSWSTTADRAVAEWKSRNLNDQPRATSPPASSSPRVSTAPQVREWHGRDLARNRSGARVAAEAQARTTWRTHLGRALGLRTAAGAWREGSAGERLVGQTLVWARLFGWRALHSVPVGSRGSDIDHVLIGPGGVVTVNTKHHRGQRVKAGRDAVFVGTRETRYAQNSLFEAGRAARLLSAAAGPPVKVAPIIVVVGASELRGRKTQGVIVLGRGELLLWLLFRRRVLNKATRDELYAIARRETTWVPA